MTRTAHFYIKIFIIGILGSFILGYAYYQSRSYIAGPQLTIETPKNGTRATSSLVIIQGKAKNISRISLNDRAIYIDEQGVFVEKILLSPGYNIFKIEVEDKFERKKQEFLELVYSP